MKKQFKELPGIVKRLAEASSEAAYQELFNILYSPLRKFAFCMLHSNEEAEEVAEDVLVTLWRKRKTLSDINNIHVYALVIAKNLSLNILQKRSRYNTASLDEIDVSFCFDNSTPEQIIIDNELKKRLENAIQSLPPKCQLVFKLAKENDLSYKEIGEVLSISVKTVDAHLVAATQKLAKIFKEEFQIK
ncbi:RNA polymerase sigma factor [Daejeonella lutea]|uniref:RNA polymerase sigma-70 factor, ECF subfamily n=1 Tax=Daejeonella lutea TaxID=572036 RepID=A0A1T5EDR8_9SPHI|nr:RNA polymerase sigma-70 factor [Daejeonella lutea]SKB82063.1 RNA polymerase sigma-70 factor, ECF subfamily [Daejeonella lutea]